MMRVGDRRQKPRTRWMLTSSLTVLLGRKRRRSVDCKKSKDKIEYTINIDIRRLVVIVSCQDIIPKYYLLLFPGKKHISNGKFIRTLHRDLGFRYIIISSESISTFDLL